MADSGQDFTKREKDLLDTVRWLTELLSGVFPPSVGELAPHWYEERDEACYVAWRQLREIDPDALDRSSGWVSAMAETGEVICWRCGGFTDPEDGLPCTCGEHVMGDREKAVVEAVNVPESPSYWRWRARLGEVSAADQHRRLAEERAHTDKLAEAIEYKIDLGDDWVLDHATDDELVSVTRPAGLWREIKALLTEHQERRNG